jgi:hypothetical protein
MQPSVPFACMDKAQKYGFGADIQAGERFQGC